MTLSSVLRSLRRVWAMAVKETAHIRRDPQTLVMALVMPVVLLLLFGFGVTFDFDHLPVVAVDQDRTSHSRKVVRAFAVSGELSIAFEDSDVQLALSRMRQTKAVAVVVIPEGFARSRERGEPSSLQLLVDGADASTANLIIGKSEAILATSLPVPPVTVVARVPRLVIDTWTLYNPGGSSAYLLVPGLTAMILAIVCVLLTALTVAREWERGSMEQLFTTPVRRGELIVGKLLPYVGLGLVAVLLVLAAGAWVFDVPLRGSLSTLSLAALLFLIGMLAQGLFISVLTKNQMVATQVGTMTSMLPTQILSGFVFPIANMPLALQGLAQLLPATHFIAVLRGVLLRGNGWQEQTGHLLALLAFAVVMVLITANRFRRRLD